MKKNIAIVLAFLALAFVGCEKNAPYKPGEPAETPQFIYFPVASETGVELDPTAGITSKKVNIARLDTAGELDVAIKVLAASDSAFIFPDSVHFNSGEALAAITVQFDKMEVGETYGFTIEAELSKEGNPYAAASPFYQYEATLIKYIDAVGVWQDEVIGPSFGYPVLAWKVNYQYAILPSGNMKLRLLNPYSKTATSQDEDGLYDGNPLNTTADFIPDTESDYNFMLLVDSKTDSVRFSTTTTWLGVSADGMGKIGFYDYAGGEGTYGKYHADSAYVVFDATDNSMLLRIENSLYGINIIFHFYLNVQAYLDANATPAVDAEVSTYEGTWKLSALDLETDAAVEKTITITSEEDPTEGQYYSITGLHADLSTVYGYFDASTHKFVIESSKADDEVEISGKTYNAYLVPVNDDGTEKKSMMFAPAENDSIVLTDDSEATGFMIIYVNKDDESEEIEGPGMYQISLTKAAAAPAPAKAAKRPRTHALRYTHKVANL